MMEKFLVLCRSRGFHAGRRLAAEAVARRLDLTLAEYREIWFDHDGRFLRIRIGEEGLDLRDFTHFVFRDARGVQAIRDAAITAVCGTGRILNLDAYRQTFGFYNKLMQLVRLSEAGLPLVPTRLTSDPQRFDAGIAEVLTRSAEALLKPVAGGGGAGIRRVSGSPEGLGAQDPAIGRTFVQDYLPVDHDFRIIVLGGKVFGAMRRDKPEGSAVSNVTQGGQVSAARLDASVEHLSLEAARVMGTEFAGVDIMIDAGRPYLLEVNPMPEFEGFEAATGLNVAGGILDTLLAQPRGPARPIPALFATGGPGGS